MGLVIAQFVVRAKIRFLRSEVNPVVCVKVEVDVVVQEKTRFLLGSEICAKVCEVVVREAHFLNFRVCMKDEVGPVAMFVDL